MASSQDLVEVENAQAWEDVPIRLSSRRRRNTSRQNHIGDLSSLPTTASPQLSTSYAQKAIEDFQGLQLSDKTTANTHANPHPVRSTSERPTPSPSRNQKTNISNTSLPSTPSARSRTRQIPRDSQRNESALPSTRKETFPSVGNQGGRLIPNSSKPTSTIQGSLKQGRGHNHNNNNNNRSGQSGSHGKFPKNFLVTTAQLNAQQLEKERLANQERFRKPPPAGEILENCLFYEIEEDLGTPEELFGDTLDGLNTIREGYQVYIDSHDSGNKKSLRLRCADQDSILPAWQAIERAIKDVLAEGTSQPAENVIEPSLPERMRLKVIPILKNLPGGNGKKESSIIHKVEVNGSESAMKMFREWTRDHEGLETEEHKNLAESLSKAFARLRYLRSGARMRLHFGWLEIFRYKKDFLDKKYDLDEFREMMKSFRTQATLEKSLGSAFTALKIISHISDPNSKDFMPKDSRLDEASQVKPKFTLIMLTSSDIESIRLEADIDTIDGEESYQMGETRFYRNGTRKTRLTVNVMDLNSHVDCSLEVVTHEEITIVPTALYKLVEGSISQGIFQRYDKHGNKYPFVNPEVPKGIHVEKVIIRSNWQYRLAAAGRYIFEIAVYRTWDGHNTSLDPMTTCGAQFYNREWDQMLGPASIIGETQDWEDGLEDLLPKTDTSSGVTAFLTEAAHIKNLLGVKIGISRESAARE